MKLSKKIRVCKMFGGHKWEYAKIYREIGGIDKQFIRVCKKCNLIQSRSRHFTGDYIWSNAIQFTKMGAKLYVEGYDE